MSVDRIRQLEYEVARLSRQIGSLPSRWALGGSGGKQLHEQLALVTDVVSGTPEYYDTTVDLEWDMHNGPIVQAVLLDVGQKVAGGGLLDVYQESGDTLADLKFYASDVRKEGNPKAGDVVRVWTEDGSHVSPGEQNYDSGGATWTGRRVYCDSLNPTDYLRGLSTWDETKEQIVGHHANETDIVWDELAGNLADLPPWIFDPDFPEPSGSGTTYGEGYCIEIEDSDPDLIHFNPITADAGTQATGFAAAFQFFVHDSDAAARTDAKWTTATGYDNTKTQLLGHVSGTWHAKTIADWLKLLEGYVEGNQQVLAHDTDGTPEWKTVSSDTINNPTGVGIALINSNTELESTLNYTPVTIKTWPATSDGAADEFTATEDATECQ